MASPSVTWTFTNGTTSDATQVNTNFTDLINGLTDGTKDLNVSALTAAGTFTANGHVTLGNSTADDLTLTAALASSVSVKTNATYNIGGSTSGLLSAYFGNGSFTTRLLAGTLTASYTITLPVASPGQDGRSLVFSSSGVSEFRYRGKTSSAQTSTFTAAGDIDVYLLNSSGGAFTVNLPVAANFPFKVFKFLMTANALATPVTIDADGSETIGGASTVKMHTIGQILEVTSDGANWQITNHRAETAWASYTATTAGLGTIADLSSLWKRSGDTLHVRGKFTCGTVSAAIGTISLPSGPTIDFNLLPPNLTNQVGAFYCNITTTLDGIPSGTTGPFPLVYNSGTSTSAVILCTRQDLNQAAAGTHFELVNANALSLNPSSDGFNFSFSVPITDWLA